MKKKICIFGTGGFGKEVLCCLIDIYKNEELNEIACFMVDDENYTTSSVLGIDVLRFSDFNPELYDLFVAVGDPVTRKKIVEKMPNSTTYATIIHPSVILSKWVEIGEGSILTAGSILTCNIRLGKHSHLNLNTTIGHDCNFEDYFTTAPNVNISGNCNFGECVYFGTSSSVRQGISICDNVTIGMGAVVVKSIVESGIYIGSPAKKLEKK